MFNESICENYRATLGKVDVIFKMLGIQFTIGIKLPNPITPGHMGVKFCHGLEVLAKPPKFVFELLISGKGRHQGNQDQVAVGDGSKLFCYLLEVTQEILWIFSIISDVVGAHIQNHIVFGR